METIQVEALFLVLTPTWTESMQSFVADRVDPESRRSVNDFTAQLRRAELPIFLDRSSVKNASLGVMRFAQGEVLDDSDTSVHVLTQLWHPKGFLLRIRAGKEVLDRLHTGQQHLMPESFGWRVNTLFRRSISRPPRYLGEIVTFVEPALDQVGDISAAQQFCRGIDIRFRDVFWGGGDHHVLFLMDPTPLNAASHQLIAASQSAADSVGVDMDRFLWYVGTRSIEDLTVDEAEDETKKALSFRAAIRDVGTAPSWLSLLASIHPGYHDPFDQVTAGIGVINGATQQLAKLKTDLNGLRQVYESSFWWRDGRLTLVESHVARGDLIVIQDDEVGNLTLTTYMKRSALNILNFYVERIDNSVAEINALLSALQTAASIKSAKQAEILNKLILILTVTSVELALLQVMSATTLWTGIGPMLFVLALLVLDLMAVMWAYRAIQRKRGNGHTELQ